MPQLAAGRAPGCAAVLDVACRLAVDRGSLRMCGRQVGPSLDAPPPMGPDRRRGGQALGRRAGHVVPGRSRSGLYGVGRDVGGHLPAPATGGGVQEVPVRRVGTRGGGGGSWHHDRPVAGARRWRTSLSSPMAAWSRSTIPSRDRFAMPAPCWSSRRHRVPSPGQRLAPANTPTRCSPRTVPAPHGPSPALGSEESLAHPLAGVRVLDLGLGVAGPFTGTCSRRPRSRRHQDQRAARHLLERHAHGSRHEPWEAQHRAQSQGPGRQGGTRAAAAGTRT